MSSGVRLQELTLYDAFGYLIPGASIVAWTILVPWDGLRAWAVGGAGTVTFWVGAIVLSYLAGHLAQALGNRLPKRPRGNTVGDMGFGSETERTLRNVIRRQFGEGAVAEEDVFRFCAAFVKREGCFRDGELFEYREGFYRGMWVVTGVAFLEVVVAYLTGQHLGLPWGGPVRQPWIATLAALGIAFWLLGARYFRFRGYVVRGTYVSFCECVLAGGTARRTTPERGEGR